MVVDIAIEILIKLIPKSLPQFIIGAAVIISIVAMVLGLATFSQIQTFFIIVLILYFVLSFLSG